MCEGPPHVNNCNLLVYTVFCLTHTHTHTPSLFHIRVTSPYTAISTCMYTNLKLALDTDMEAISTEQGEKRYHNIGQRGTKVESCLHKTFHPP